MALVLSTNCGFVETAPTSNPDGTLDAITTESKAFKVTSPGTATKITELGWYVTVAGAPGDYQIGIYDHNSGDNNPEDLISSESGNNSGADRWIVHTGLNISISSSTTYWLAVQHDSAAPVHYIDVANSGGQKVDHKTSQSSLTDPWGASDSSTTQLMSVYAVWEVAETGTNLQLNIGDAWKTVDGVKINIGDVWKDVEGMQVNIGDAWKTIF